VVQGVFFQFGSLLAAFWWLLIGFYLFIRVVLQKASKVISGDHLFMHIGFHLIGWGIPTISTAISLGTHTIGFAGTLPWCFINYVTYSQYELYNYLVIVLFVSLCGSVFLIASTIQVARLTFRSKNDTRGRLPRQTTRLLFLLLLFLYIYAFYMAFRFDTIRHNNLYRHSYVSYVTCRLENQFLPGKSVNDCEWNQKLSPVIFFIFIFNASIQGILIFIFFGMNPEMFRFWKHVIQTRTLEDTSDNSRAVPLERVKKMKDDDNRKTNNNVEMDGPLSRSDYEKSSMM